MVSSCLHYYNPVKIISTNGLLIMPTYTQRISFLVPDVLAVVFIPFKVASLGNLTCALLADSVSAF